MVARSFSMLFRSLSIIIIVMLDFLYSLSPSVSIIYSFQQVLQSTPCVCKEVQADPRTLARPCEGVHRRTSLKSSPLLFQLCPACLVRRILMIFEMGSCWPYNCCFVGYCFQDLFSILVLLPSSFFSIHLVRVQVVHLYSSMDTTAAWKNAFYFIEYY